MSGRRMWTVRALDDRDPAAPFTVWSSDDGRIYAELGACYELVKPTSAAGDSNVIRWWPGEPDHPIIDELRSRPGEWGVLWERVPDVVDRSDIPDSFWACDRHKRVEVHVQRRPGLHASDQTFSARWIPDDEWARIQGAKLAAKEAKSA